MSVLTLALKLPCRSWGMPQANSMTSSPRAISPSASLRVLPSSAVTTRARRSRLAATSSRKAKRTLARADSDAWRQSANAVPAAATAASTSAEPAKSTSAVTSPVAGSKTLPCLAASADQGLPPIQCVMRRISARSPDRALQHGIALVGLSRGQAERRRDPEHVAVEPALADQQAAVLAGLQHLAGGRRPGPRRPRLDQLDADHEALAANVADDGGLTGKTL